MTGLLNKKILSSGEKKNAFFFFFFAWFLFVYLGHGIFFFHPVQWQFSCCPNPVLGEVLIGSQH